MGREREIGGEKCGREGERRRKVWREVEERGREEGREEEEEGGGREGGGKREGRRRRREVVERRKALNHLHSKWLTSS